MIAGPFPLALVRTARIAIVIAMLVAASHAAPVRAARVFPDNSFQARITEVAGDMVVASGRRLHLAPGLLIHTPTNATLVRGALPADALVRIQLDLQGDVRRIWLLADDEVVATPWWRFWNRDETQEQPRTVPLAQ